MSTNARFYIKTTKIGTTKSLNIQGDLVIIPEIAGYFQDTIVNTHEVRISNKF